MNSFTSPEGTYELAYEVLSPPPATPATPGVSAAAALAAAAGGVNPEHPATLSTAVIHFPPISSSGSGLLGLGSQRAGRTREASVSQDSATYSQGPNVSDDQTSLSNSGSSYDHNSMGQPLAGQSPGSGRKKPLVSLPSMPNLSSMPSLGGSSAQPQATASTSKPKNAFRGTSSTFVKAYEGLPLSARAEKLWQGVEPRQVTLAVFTTPRAVFIADISPRAKTRDPIARIAFAAAPTTTAINTATLSHDRLDILVGFATGDIMWIEAFSGRYTRYNKDASSISQTLSNNKTSSMVSSAPVKRVQWLQGDQIFATAFNDGCLAFWDKDRDDPNSFSPSAGLAPAPGPSASTSQPLTRIDSYTDGNATDSQDGHGDEKGSLKPSRRHTSHREPLEETTDDIIVTVPQPGNDKKSAGKFNPLAHWKVSRKPITDFAISPDNQHCAVVSEDGCLRIIDCNSQKLLDTYQAYFGALSCVSWSPDGRFVLTGGQDDLACVWSPFEQRIVARCEGHSSFLTGLAFDAWRCDSRTQRFASVSEDCKLILWDLSSAALQRPKAHHQQHATNNRRASTTSALSLVRKRTIDSSANLPLTAGAGTDREAPLWHRAPNRSEVPGLQPVMVKQVSSELLAGIAFLPNMVVTISRAATVKVFIRPDQRF